VAAKRVTSIDVANLAGVSVAAVSRAFTPGASIAPNTKRRVMEAADTLGYHPNVIARSLNQRRSKLVGLVMSGWNNFGYVEILRLLTEALEAEGYEVILKSVLDRDQIGATVRQVLQYQVAAIAVVSEVLPADISASCARQGVPIVLVNRIGRGAGNSAVSLDGAFLGQAIADFFLQRKHQRIALLRGRADIDFTSDVANAIAERIAPARDCTVMANLTGVLGYAAGRRCINELFDQPEPPDGVFCSYDETAIGVIDGARIDLGVSVPDELAVIGNGNRAVAAWGSHDLTTVEYPRDEVIQHALRILLARLEDPDLEPETTLLKTNLVVRGSTRPEPA
jgi:DNA-binding LacI/PurR family transcriptional regulator